MKLNSLHIEGFRSMRNIIWRPGRLNVLIGPNGSGKSNLIKALRLMLYSASGKLYDSLVNMGGVSPLLWDGQVDKIKWNIQISNDNEILDYQYLLRYREKSGTYFIQEESLKNLQDRKEILPSELTEKTKHIPVEITPGEEEFSFTETILSQTDKNISSPEIKSLKQWLKNILIYHDMPVDENASLRRPSVVRVEKKVNSDGRNLVTVLHTLYSSNSDFRADIDIGMNGAFNNEFLELVFPPAEDQRIQLKVKWKSMKRAQGMADLSDGTIKYLLLLTILSSPELPPLLIIDEPENGLHPSMFPIIAEYAVEASERGTQVIFTTHSPQFLDAFEDVTPTTTVMKWENGETILKTIDGEELDYWLKEYSLGSLFRSGELEDM